MKKKDIQDLKVKSDAELMRLIKEDRDRLRALRFDLAAGKVKNVKALHDIKAAIARAMTFLHERTMAKAK